jgi:hypothetical protein
MPKLLDILAKGYFPRELPPPFGTSAFAEAMTGKKGLVSGFTAKPAEKRVPAMCVHNMVRSGGLRRNLGIPNPVAYAELAAWIVRRWGDLQPVVTASPFSRSKPVEEKAGRAIWSEYSLDDRPAHRVELRANARFVLHADINRFYPSIYTHVLPWAVDGKSTIKKAMADGELGDFWSNELDVLVRGLNESQTVGIPIGPDCSLVLAELLLGRVDAELQSRFPELKGMRYIDDYEFVFQERSDAEQVSQVLQSLLAQFELALNPAKTCVTELPDVVEPMWTSRIRTFVFRDAGIKGQRNDLTSYFDTVFTFVRAQPNEDILKYAVPRLNGVDVREENWDLYEHLLAQCALTEPACLPQVTEQLIHYASVGCSISKRLWHDCLNRIISERLPLGQASEPVWAMWLMRLFELRLNADSEKAVAGCEDSVAALMGLGLASVGLAKPAALAPLNAFAEPTELLGPQWLLCYEGAHRGWIKAPSGNDTMASDPRFEFLHKKDVSFFDITVGPPAPRRHTGAGGGGGGGGGY